MEPDDQEFDYDWIRSDISFDDVAGYYGVKERLAEEVLQPVQEAARSDDRYDRFGIEPSRGILFYGTPGTGKTMFARALAGELEVPIVELGSADVMGKWISEGPQPVRQLFEEADSIGRCVILLNEVEYLFDNRSAGAEAPHAESREVISELFVHLGADDRTAIVVGTTNRPEDIKPAIIGPRRLATQVEIGLPRKESRRAILQSKLRGVSHNLTGDQLAQLANHTAGLSGADIEKLITEAKHRATQRDAQTVSIEDFPTPEEFDAMTENIRRGSTTGVNVSGEN